MLSYCHLSAKTDKSNTVPFYLYLIFLLALGSSQALAQSADLMNLSLEELMNIEITSVSRRPEKIAQAAAAVAVISREDIRHSGATNIPEALRLVPGMQVVRIDANKWGITARGFNDLFPNKLLVLIDGRSVYTPLFSGVFWEAQDVLLEDVERIEVIRGPGATLWGANAVNGVINIITRQASATQGTALNIGGGSEERFFANARYGAPLGKRGHYRIYGKFTARDNLVDASGRSRSDAWEAGRGGGRADWQLSDNDQLSLQAAIYKGEVGQTFSSITAPDFSGPKVFDSTTPFSGGHILGRWQHDTADSSNLALQLYYDRTRRIDEILGGILNIADLDFQHRWPLHRHEFIWGLGYRLTLDEVKQESFSFTSATKNNDVHLFSAFAQDAVTLVEERLRLTLGSKFERNSYTGLEIQPNLRLLWTPHQHHTLWASASRAVRTPSRVESDMSFLTQAIPRESLPDGALPTFIAVLGNKALEAEDLLAYELGYRLQPSDRLSLDLATYFNVYNDLRTTETHPTYRVDNAGQPYTVIPLVMENRMHGNTYGAEVLADWHPLQHWRYKAGYTFLQMDLKLDRGSSYLSLAETAGTNPRHQLFIRSSMDLSANVELDLLGRFVDKLPTELVKSYFSLDVRLAWRPSAQIELALVGQNLLQNRHLEYGLTFGPTLASQVQRGLYGSLRWNFDSPITLEAPP